ncbi:S8 family serine peptidase [Wenjunlia tyrosinilytica]|uniref:Serine protease n=1 Tax=Wenjunlia tyrosinilytica TaxID=1544741 RepID=A0A918DSE6_9ACTN|nr:S8 family serine peptidase [Wenjunlia tyrosinilytica]GGO80968.1 serine protease [Wenjunlia tyrosinilytica]
MLTNRSARRRISRVALCAGLVAALGAIAPLPAFAHPGNAAPAPAAKEAGDKLGSSDADLLAKAKAKGDKNITMMIATAPGATEKVAAGLDDSGASVGRVYDKLGYVRATVPTARADRAIAAASKLSSVHGIDLKQVIKVPDPTPGADSTKAARHKGKKSAAYPGPGKDTPAKNPYQPAFETGAVDFVHDHPEADGRGVTIGILDSGVDLGHPALQKTTTGERKIVDWVTATDPIVDGDATWRPMVTAVSGSSFTFNKRTYTAPNGDYLISLFKESATTGGDMAGDLNRDGDTTDSWAVLYDAAAGTVRVDLDDNADFGDDTEMKPYKDGYRIGYFGKDNPDTAISEQIPFVVQIRKDVPMDPFGGPWVGKKADFVNIGVIESEHGTHVAGITAANGLFGGRMNGAAPGAKLVSSRACTWSGGCTNVALTEGMIDLVVNRGVDVVNMSIGGLPALNDGNNARSELYTRLIDTYGVQLIISAGNSGPGANTIGDPGLANKVISVGASVSKETWAANYGSQVAKKYAMFPFSSRGPREDGGFTPTITAPGASINTIPTWEPGAPVAEAGYQLPPGYGMLQGTSMASPQTTGAAALLLSAAKAKHIDLTPAKLRTALISTAHKIPGHQAYEQGSGLIDINEAWDLIGEGVSANTYSVQAPVRTALSQFLKTPDTGTGIYDRESDLKPNESKSYEVAITRTSGPDRPVRHSLSWENNDGSFKLAGPGSVTLPLNQPVKVKVTAKGGAGIHSAILDVDDYATGGVDHQILATVVVSTPLAKPSYTFTRTSTVQRNSTKSYFVKVPAGAKSLEIGMGGLATGSQTRFIAINPYGVPVDPTSTPLCYPNYDNPANTCRPDLRSYASPLPGVWEIEVESRRTSPVLDNQYTLGASVLGVSFDPAVKTVDEATPGTPAPVGWTVKNDFAAIDGKLKGGALGSAAASRPSIKEGETRTSTLVLGAGASRLDVAIGGTSDSGADLDLNVYRDGTLVGSSADGDSEEAVSLKDPAAGTYTFEVIGYAVPAGSTDYDYRDVFFSSSLGEVKVDESKTVKLSNGQSAPVSAEVLVNGAAPEGRQFFGEVRILNARGTAAGAGSVLIKKVNG